MSGEKCESCGGSGFLSLKKACPDCELGRDVSHTFPKPGPAPVAPAQKSVQRNSADAEIGLRRIGLFVDTGAGNAGVVNSQQSRGPKCQKCGDSGHTVVQKHGIDYALRCECLTGSIKQQRVTRSMSTIPPEFEHATLQSFNVRPETLHLLRQAIKTASQYVQDFQLDRSIGLLFMGPTGTGKSHLAVAAYKELVELGEEGMYLHYHAFLDGAAREFSNDDKSKDASTTAQVEDYKRAFNVPLLLLDDIGSRRPLEWTEDVVTKLILHRAKAKLPLIVTSNYPLDPRTGGTETRSGSVRSRPVLAEYIGERAASRLREFDIVETWGLPDYRGQRQRQRPPRPQLVKKRQG